MSLQLLDLSSKLDDDFIAYFGFGSADFLDTNILNFCMFMDQTVKKPGIFGCYIINMFHLLYFILQSDLITIKGNRRDKFDDSLVNFGRSNFFVTVLK